MTKDIKKIISKFDKVTEVRFTLDEQMKQRPESMEDTHTQVQSDFLKELYENKNPYYVGDFLVRMAMVVAIDPNAFEGTLKSKNGNFEEVVFKFKMTEEGKKNLKKLRSSDSSEDG